MKKDNIPKQGNPKTDQDDTGDPVDDRQGPDGELAPQPTCHHDFSDIGAHIDQQTDGKNNDAFAKGMVER